MISYYEKINISELICFEGKVALVSDKTFFSHSSPNQISDIGLIDQFYIVDVKKTSNSFIHITSMQYNEFKNNFQIDKINFLLNNTLNLYILSIANECKNKKLQLVKIIEDKIPCQLINYYISRFGLLLVFREFYFENNLFLKKLIDKCKASNKENLLFFSIKTKYQILDKTFIWLYFPEDLFLINNKDLFEKYLGLYDINLLFKPVFDFKFLISAFPFEIYKGFKPTHKRCVYLQMNQQNFSLFYYNDKNEEIYKNNSLFKLYKDYINISSEIYKIDFY